MILLFFFFFSYKVYIYNPVLVVISGLLKWPDPQFLSSSIRTDRAKNAIIRADIDWRQTNRVLSNGDRSNDVIVSVNTTALSPIGTVVINGDPRAECYAEANGKIFTQGIRTLRGRAFVPNVISFAHEDSNQTADVHVNYLLVNTRQCRHRGQLVLGANWPERQRGERILGPRQCHIIYPYTKCNTKLWW
jgi:hypothetical protein